MVKLRGKAWKHNWKQITFKIFLSNLSLLLLVVKLKVLLRLRSYFQERHVKNGIDSKKKLYIVSCLEINNYLLLKCSCERMKFHSLFHLKYLNPVFPSSVWDVKSVLCSLTWHWKYWFWIQLRYRVKQAIYANLCSTALKINTVQCCSLWFYREDHPIFSFTKMQYTESKGFKVGCL